MQIISRAEWGARHRAGFGARRLPVAEAWLHHTVMGAPTSPAGERAEMRKIEQVGQQRFGAGVSYNLVVMPSGRVYEGCGASRVGAHTARRNTTSLGIVLAGNYDTAAVSAPMRQALSELLRYAHGWGWLTAPRFTGGHRDAPGASTACPGRNAHRLIPTLNAAAAAQPRPTEEDTDMQYRAIVRVEDGAIALTSPGYFRHVSPAEWASVQAAGLVNTGPDDVTKEQWELVRMVALGSDR